MRLNFLQYIKIREIGYSALFSPIGENGERLLLRVFFHFKVSHFLLMLHDAFLIDISFCLVVAFLFEVLLHWECTNMCVLFLLKAAYSVFKLCVYTYIKIYLNQLIFNAYVRGHFLRLAYPFGRSLL